MIGGFLHTSWLLSALIWLSAGAAVLKGQPRAPADSDCMACHEDASLKRADGRPVFVDLKGFKKSVHGQMEVNCVSCHADLKGVTEFPHAEKLAPASCSECHDKPLAAFGHSIHSQKQAKLGGRALSCVHCHDAHNVLPAGNPASPTSPFKVQDLCLKCHRNAMPATNGRATNFVASYEESIHARALKKTGLNISATCITCHGSHDVRAISDPASPVTRKNIPDTCGSCHGGVLAEYKESIHGVSFQAGKMEAPVCTDCHGEHKVQSPTLPSSKVYSQNVPETCARCHQDERIVRRFNLATKRLASFRSSFHGIALRFGELKVANCASCHGYHDILPASDPGSRVHPANIPRTCGSCHANAGTNWAQGKVHIAEPGTDNHWVYVTQEIYAAGIGGSMAVFLLYIFADLWAWRRRRKDGSR